MRQLLILATALLAGCGKIAPVAKPAALPAVRFTDVTEMSGVALRQRHGGCGKASFVEQTGAGVAVFDADGDGDLDLYFPQPSNLPGCPSGAPLRPHLYENDGSGHFTEIANAGGAIYPDYGIGACTGDYDRDGRQDLFVSCWGRSRLFRNEGGMHFRDVTAEAGIDRRGYSTSSAWLDYDRDGRLDLFVTGYVDFDPNAVTVCPAPDGRPDYCTPEVFSPDRHALYRNRGDGTFEEVTKKAGLLDARGRALGVAACDFDSDGAIDLFIANDSSANNLFKNDGKGRFTDQAMLANVAYGETGKPLSNMGVSCGDYDRDGDPDLFITTFANEPFPLLANQGGFFKNLSSTAGLAIPTYVPLGFGVEIRDFNQDGWLDAFFANGHVEQHIAQRSKTQTFAQANQLFLGAESGAFLNASAGLPADDVRVHRGAASGDLDGDGDLDLVVTALDDRPTILRNDGPTGAWLTLDLRDRHGSASVVGAKATVRGLDREQTAWVVGGGGYISQSDYALHFGFASSNGPVRVEVSWPDGTKLVQENVALGQRLRVQQR